MLFTLLIVGTILWGMVAFSAIGGGMMSVMSFGTEEEGESNAFPKQFLVGLVILVICCVLAITMSWIDYAGNGAWISLAWDALPIVPVLALFIILLMHR